MKQQKSTAKIRNEEDLDVSYETKIIESNFKNRSNLKNLHNKRVGMLGEDFAVEYLENQGFKIFERNFAMKFGEIDIVAVSYETADSYAKQENKVAKVYIIEVKTSVSHENSRISAIDNAHMQKLRKVAKVGEFYVKEKFVSETPFSICVCLIQLNKDLSLKDINFIKDIEIY